MILLDEQMREDQRVLLRKWRIRFRQIGKEIGPSGIQDPDIIPFLHTLKRPTLFTLDHGFFKPRLCHSGYCLACLDVTDIRAAEYIRRFLRHSRFDTSAKRLGIVARARPSGVDFWKRGMREVQRVSWAK